VRLVVVTLLVPVRLVRVVEPEKLVSVSVVELEMVSVSEVLVRVWVAVEVTVKVFEIVEVAETELVRLVVVTVVEVAVMVEIMVDEVNEVVELCVVLVDVLVAVSVVVIVLVEVLHMLTETCSCIQKARGGHSRSSSAMAICSPEPISSPVMSIGTTIKLSVPTGIFVSPMCASYSLSLQQPSSPPVTPSFSTVVSGPPSFVPWQSAK
jgi:hypothetical protein